MAVPDATPSAPPAPRDRSAPVAALAVCGLFLALAVPLIVFTPPGGRAESDESIYHLPAVQSFARDWPHFDFRGYTSATTPGYHLVVAAVARFVSGNVHLLRAVGSVFTVGLLATAAIALARRAGATTAILLCLPLVCSSYVFKAGVWILPENAAWWGLLGVLLVALRPKVDAFTYVAGGILLALLVFVRQMHLWSASVLWLAAWLGESDDAQPPDLVSSRGGLLTRDLGKGTHVAPPRDPSSASLLGMTGAALRRRFSRATVMGLATLPAFLVVAYFFRLWGGMVPEHYRLHGETRTGSVFMDGGNPAAPAMVLTLAALFGAFYLPFAWRRIFETLRTDRRAVAALMAGAVMGALVGIVPETSYDYAAGRWSGLWNLVNRLPTFANRSPLVMAPSTCGGAMLAIWLVALGRRDRWLFLATWAVFTLAQSFSSMAWQRYYEPFLLMTFALAAVRVDPAGRVPRAGLAGVGLLALFQAAITVATLR